MNGCLLWMDEWLDLTPRVARYWPDDTQWWPDGPTLPLAPLIWAGQVAGLVLVFFICRSFALRAWKRAQPYLRFHRLARRLGLAVGDEWQLWRAARLAGLRSPVTLLVCAQTMEHYAQTIQRDADRDNPRAIAEAQTIAGGLIRLRERLFD